MSLDTICDDMLGIVISYEDCRAKTKLCYVNKRLSDKYFEYNTCNLLRYRDSTILIACEKHLTRTRNYAVLNVIRQLNYAEEKKKKNGDVEVIHFGSVGEVLLANPYLDNFSIISHRCCNGKGVMYKNFINQITNNTSFYD